MTGFNPFSPGGRKYEDLCKLAKRRNLSVELHCGEMPRATSKAVDTRTFTHIRLSQLLDTGWTVHEAPIYRDDVYTAACVLLEELQAATK